MDYKVWCGPIGHGVRKLRELWKPLRAVHPVAETPKIWTGLDVLALPAGFEFLGGMVPRNSPAAGGGHRPGHLMLGVHPLAETVKLRTADGRRWSSPSPHGRSPCASPWAAPARSCDRWCTSWCRAQVWPAARWWRWRAPPRARDGSG